APGTVLRVRGRGIPAGKNGSKLGDLMVKVDVMVPKALNEDQRAAVESLAQVTEPAPRERLEEV
ncbi:MAG: molecular chaperone DnaJ, partial [Acidimicrobiales bacterium]